MKTQARFITDMGEPLVLTSDKGGTMPLGRYGVWDSTGRRKPEVVAVGDDLEALQAEYGPGLPVYLLPQGSNGSSQA